MYNEDSLLIDELEIENANATSIEDESFQLMPDGTWNLGEATIGF